MRPRLLRKRTSPRHIQALCRPQCVHRRFRIHVYIGAPGSHIVRSDGNLGAETWNCSCLNCAAGVMTVYRKEIVEGYVQHDNPDDLTKIGLPAGGPFSAQDEDLPMGVLAKGRFQSPTALTLGMCWWGGVALS
eukprot:4538520-Amphidinium_carterae.1